MSAPFHIAGTGCCLMDTLFTNVDFTGEVFQSALSQQPGDGGLTPGALVFAEEFERFLGEPMQDWLTRLTGGRPPDAENVGGPAIVALVHAAQLLSDRDVQVSFHAARGEDRIGDRISEVIQQTPVDASPYQVLPGPTPATTVLSDPTYNEGQGERTFINTIGAVSGYGPELLDETFYGSDLRLFGATALVPQLHDHLTDILREGRTRPGLQVVGTVYDFRNEQRAPDKPWPLGDTQESLPLIDLLACDQEEALRISGQSSSSEAVAYFLEHGAGAAVVTQGANRIHLGATNQAFTPLPRTVLPVSEAVRNELASGKGRHGDTTGCGDNFLGGMMVSLALQRLQNGTEAPLNLSEACAWGAASGGLACYYSGGVYQESSPGEKFSRVKPTLQNYCRQIGIQQPVLSG